MVAGHRGARVPLGVVGLIYESPHTTVDAISLCLKAGNAALLLWFWGLTRIVIPYGRMPHGGAPIEGALTEPNPSSSVYDQIVREPKLYANGSLELGIRDLTPVERSRLRLADADVLPFEFNRSATTIGRYVDEVVKLAAGVVGGDPAVLSYYRHQVIGGRTAIDILNEVGNDAARLIYVMRSNDQPLDFDLALARVKAARAAIDKAGGDVVFTARTEGFIKNRPDLDETIRELRLPQTHDLRKTVAQTLLGRGYRVRIYDPQLNLAQLDSVAADLNLMVDAPDEFQLAVRPPPRHLRVVLLARAR